MTFIPSEMLLIAFRLQPCKSLALCQDQKTWSGAGTQGSLSAFTNYICSSNERLDFSLQTFPCLTLGFESSLLGFNYSM